MIGCSTIAELNDLLRTTFLTGRVMLTEGISHLPVDVVEALLTTVRTYDRFTPDDDPYGEHDFGAFDQEGVGRVFWKIDYYDTSMAAGSTDPSNPKATLRVLTRRTNRQDIAFSAVPNSSPARTSGAEPQALRYSR
jgi:hypothetical protein